MADKKKKYSKKKLEALKKRKKELLFKKKIEEIRSKYREKISKFNKNHVVYLDCYPQGIKLNSKRVPKVPSIKQHIHICRTICGEQCVFFTRKTYLCKDLGCTNHPICIGLSVEKRKKMCKKKGLFKDRVKLNKLYNKYFKVYAIYRGFKIDPVKTLRYLKKVRKQKENG